MATDDSPTFVAYGNNLLQLTWSTPAACQRADDGRDDDRSDAPGGTGEPAKKGRRFFGVLGLLLWLMFLGLGLYFAVGACAARTRGWDGSADRRPAAHRHLLQLHDVWRARQGPAPTPRLLARPSDHARGPLFAPRGGLAGETCGRWWRRRRVGQQSWGIHCDMTSARGRARGRFVSRKARSKMANQCILATAMIQEVPWEKVLTRYNSDAARRPPPQSLTCPT